MDWRISGICFWLFCTNFGCEIKYSVKVTHFLPDVVISSYSESSPWVETGTWNPTNGAALTNKNTVDQTNIDFKHVTVIGDPALLILNQLGENSEYFCTSGETSFSPYFLSSLDSNGWHEQIPELFYPQAWLGDPRIGNWQQLYPRCGWTTHPDDPESAAVTAMRAAHIVSRSRQPHVYNALENACGDDGKKCWPPGEYDPENEEGEVKWQMITPVEHSSYESLYAESEKSGENWSDGKNTTYENYAWHLWRKYSCCEPEGAFLFSVDFE
jgi:integrating conjugative element protein (TIGR03756 family)